MLDYIWSVAHEPFGPREITTKAGMSFRISDIRICLCRSIPKTTGRKPRATEGSGGCKACRAEGLAAFASRTFKASRPRRVDHMEFRTSVDPSRRPEAVKKSLATRQCGFAACCAESLRLSGKRLNPKSLVLSLRSGRAEPFRIAGGRAAISLHLPRVRGSADPLLETWRNLPRPSRPAPQHAERGTRRDRQRSLQREIGTSRCGAACRLEVVCPREFTSPT